MILDDIVDTEGAALAPSDLSQEAVPIAPTAPQKELNISQAIVYGWISAGLLACYRFGAKGRRGAIRVAEADLAALLESLRKRNRQQEVEPTASGFLACQSGRLRGRRVLFFSRRKQLEILKLIPKVGGVTQQMRIMVTNDER
jgi:hypothetical protein